MAIRNIVQLGDETLRKKSFEVTAFDEKLHQLLDDMKETLIKANGAGLAAPQVGILRRIVIVDTGDELVELINPEIIESEGEQEEVEGCLSVPDVWGITQRPYWVKVKAMNKDGEEFTIGGEDLLGRCFCHELDHLDGHLFTDKTIRYLTAEEVEEMRD